MVIMILDTKHGVISIDSDMEMWDDGDIETKKWVR